MTQTGSLRDYEKLASFYLGKKFDLAGNRLLEEKLLYDAKDLTTHAMCVGMTGSGKTGLCLSLLEEAALDQIPAICIDPKGDLGNLLLAFPSLSADEFAKWVEPAEAARKGVELADYARQVAESWRTGLQAWDQGADRVQRFRDSVDANIYTPGSNIGIPLTVLKSFDAPPAAVMEDAELLRERIAGAASGLLALVGVSADPLSSREHILLSNLFDNAWRNGRSLDLPELIRSIQSPPLSKIGVFDMESFFPAAERMKFSMLLNNLLASPTFAGWLEGQPLDIKSLLHNAQGKPRLSIISIAHLTENEKMFFVTIFLNELLSWMRTQPGTAALRSIFYMDEVYGYFPPTAKPPSKAPMLVLLKQARAFGLGIVLATQNPVDLDYKGLSNIGTWFLGRLQTQRDKERVLDGLEGAAAQTGSSFQRGEMEQTLAALGNRVFLMNNVHDQGPTIFQTRWAMSYLRGPLSRVQIKKLMDERLAAIPGSTARDERSPPDISHSSETIEAPVSVQGPSKHVRPIVPHAIEERFVLASRRPEAGVNLVYRPTLLAKVSCHYVRVSAQLDTWVDRTLLVSLEHGVPEDMWSQANEVLAGALILSRSPEEGYEFAELPAEMLNAKNYKGWEKELRNHLYRHVPIRLFKCVELNATSRPGQDELDARLDWQQEVREKRDEEIDKLRAKFESQRAGLESRIRTAQQRLEREQAQYDQEKWKTAINFGETILGAFLGNKVRSRTATTGRGIGRAAQQRTDVLHAHETLDSLMQEKDQLMLQCEREIDQLHSELSIHGLTLQPLEIACRKGDIRLDLLALSWIPCQIGLGGLDRPLVEWPSN